MVSDGQGLIVESSVNGIWEIINSTTDTFELKDCYANSDFLDNNQATWSTGDWGEGYDSNVSLTILGGVVLELRLLGLFKTGKLLPSLFSREAIFTTKFQKLWFTPEDGG